jgi:hypothetical protein
MARRKAARRRRSPRKFSVLNALEAYTYSSIISRGVFGTSPVGFITGKDDFAYTETPAQYGANLAVGNTYSDASGFNQISLQEIISKPEMALGFAQVNLRRNLVPMAIQSFMTSITFRVGKALLRKPLANVNRNIMSPLGVGVKL